MNNFSILAFNGSPREEKSNTDIVLQLFLQGAKDNGAKIETIYTHKVNVNECIGCYSCWKKTPGVCVFKDDMVEILEKIKTSDLIIWATPLYCYSMTSSMKKIIDRRLPLSLPYVVKSGNYYRHPSRYESLPKKTILMSNCGFPEKANFDGLKETFRLMNSKTDQELIMTILWTCGKLISLPELKEHLKWFFDAIYEAGKEITVSGKISNKTKNILKKNIFDSFMSVDDIVFRINENWKIEGENVPTREEALSGTYEFKGEKIN